MRYAQNIPMPLVIAWRPFIFWLPFKRHLVLGFKAPINMELKPSSAKEFPKVWTCFK